MRLYLIGFMGSGKTTLARKIAKQLNIDFLDLDQKIEEHSGKSISRIFSESGSTVFRDMETMLLKELSTKSSAIISLGGGTPCFNDNMAFIKESGISIYLEGSPKFLYSRLKNAREKRPLISDLSDDELLGFIEKSLVEREEYYRQADIIVQLPLGDLDSLISSLGNSIQGKR